MSATVSAHPAPIVALDGPALAIERARRAVLADRYRANSLAVEWRDLAELQPIVSEWGALAARALEPNVFYEPAFLLAAAPVFARDAGAMLVWSGNEPRRLVGLFPARVTRRRYAIDRPILLGLTHPYGPLGVPLVEREAAEPVIAAWLAALAADQSLPGVLLLPLLPREGPFAAALEAIVRRARMPTADFNRHQRALLAPRGERALYVEQALGQHQHKELRRHWRRLSEAGAVLFTAATEPAAVAAALEDFFALEAAGWKGRAGTAASDHDELRRFTRAAVIGFAAESKVLLNRILVDGAAIAAAIVLRSGRRAWFWKIAYDEGFARFSPGVMLSVALTDELLDEPGLESTDSCATADHPMIDHLWRERLAMGDRLIAVRPQTRFWLAKTLEGLRSAAIAAGKTMRHSLRRRERHWRGPGRN